MLKQIFVSAVVALVIGLGFVGFQKDPAPVSTPLSQEGESRVGNVTQTPDRYTNGVGIGPSHIIFDRSGTIGAGANQASWRNTTGRTVYVSLATITTSGTASTTFRYGIATSTASTVSDYTAPYASIINSYRIATSSPATTTSNLARSLGEPVVPVASGEYVNIYLQQGFGMAGCTGSVCETATSTNRGFNLSWYLRAYYKP